MLKNEDICQNYPFFKKGPKDSEAEWIYVWLHLHSSQERVKRSLWLCGYRVPKTYFSQRNQTTITLSQLSKYASNVPSFTIILHVHWQTNCCSGTIFWKFCKLTLFNTLWHLQSFVVAFNEQVKNTEKSKASFVEVVSCSTTVKARIQVRQSDVHIKPSEISTMKTQRRQKWWLWYIHASYICIVGYKSCVTHLAKWTTLFADFKCFD